MQKRTITSPYSSLNNFTITGFNNSIIIKAITLTITTNNICDIVILTSPNILPIGVKNTTA